MTISSSYLFLLWQGIQFVVDDAGGFSGVAGEFLENIADEYANIPVLLYSVHSPDTCIDPKSKKQTISRKLHDVVSFSRLSASCKLVVPVGLPSFSMSKHYQHGLSFFVFHFQYIERIIWAALWQGCITFLWMSMHLNE